MRRMFAVGLALLISAQSAVASQSLLPSPQRNASRNPYGKLFAVPPVQTKTPPRAQTTEQPGTGKPKVVCGMTIIPADPTVDGGIQALRQQSDVRYSIRAIEPPLCK